MDFSGNLSTLVDNRLVEAHIKSIDFSTYEFSTSYTFLVFYALVIVQLYVWLMNRVLTLYVVHLASML